MNRLFLISILLVFLACQVLSANENKTFTFNSIVDKVELKSVYPRLPINMDYHAVLKKVQVPPTFKDKYHFVLENDKIYFMTSMVERPTYLTINFYLNSTLDTDIGLKKFSREIEIRETPWKKPYVLELTFRNTMDEILDAQDKLLDEVKNNVWRKKRGNGICVECFSILYIKPDHQAYHVGIASWDQNVFNDAIEEMCFLEMVPTIFFNNTGLDIDREDVTCSTLKLPKVFDRTFVYHTINALVLVGGKPNNRNANVTSLVQL